MYMYLDEEYLSPELHCTEYEKNFSSQPLQTPAVTSCHNFWPLPATRPMVNYLFDTESFLPSLHHDGVTNNQRYAFSSFGTLSLALTCHRHPANVNQVQTDVSKSPSLINVPENHNL
jgi:hypothetical protein